MRILMVNDYKDRIGGAEGYMYTLVDALRERGHEVEVFTSEVTREEYFVSLSRTSMKTLIRRLWNESAARAFGRVVKEFQPDVVHIHSLYNELSPALLTRFESAKVVLTVHDQRLYAQVTNQSSRNGQDCRNALCVGCPNCVGLLGSWYARFRWLLHRMLYRQVDAFIFPSKFMLNLFAKYTNLSPLVHIPNGFKLPTHVPWKRTNTVLFVGRLTKDKGVDVLIKAFSLLRDANLMLRVVGSGEDKPRLLELVNNLNLDKNVEFVGQLNHDEVIKQIIDCDIVAIPSQYPDNLPTVGIEAIAVGRPILASNVGGLPELVEDEYNGLLINSRDESVWSNHLYKLSQNSEKLKLMSLNAVLKSKVYDINNHVEKLINLYTDTK